MSAIADNRLGPYDILSLMGRGGMGEVYRARDTKLKREVAIKILPDEFSSDPDRVARFQREAEVLASLNHPNIAAIHNLEEANGSRFLVLELVEGETLADRIKHGAIPIEEALTIAKSICEALEAAHEKGVVHRDLKPANVKITPEGKVKVLDFGLAKAFETGTAKTNLSQSPTLSLAATNAGVILGTAAYMSPEQAKGREVDRRTDIFAFGAVLYEMLTGRAAFEGEDLQDILGAVLKSEPDWTRLPTEVPPLITRLLRLCLQKDAKKRRQTATDVRLDVEQALAEPVAAIPAAAPTRGTRVARSMFAAAVLVAVALAIPAARYLHETPPPAPPEMRLEINTPATTDPISFALSPDGRQIVFAASGDGLQRLWLRTLDAVAAQPLAGTEGAAYPFWSPDSRSIGFFADTKLKRVDIGRGSPQTLTDAQARGGTWNEDGIILFRRTPFGSLFRVRASGGEVVAVTKVDRPGALHAFPQFLPGGRKFLFYAQGTPETQGIYLGSLDSYETKRLTAADTFGVYARNGWLLFVRDGTLLAQRLDLKQAQLTGDPVTVAERVVFDGGSNNEGAFSVSATGLVAYRSGGASRRQLTWFDRSGKVVGTFGGPDGNGLSFPGLSPDGRRVAVWRIVQGNVDVWLLDSTRITRFTFDASVDVLPIWSPDGSRIVFRSDRKGAGDLYQKSSSGGGSEELLLESPQLKNANDWSSDGRFLLYMSSDPQTTDLWILPLEGDRKPYVFLKTGFQERWGKFSPDGRWVAYMSNESGRYEIDVRPFRGPSSPSSQDALDKAAGGQWQVSTAGGIYPRWRPDGKELYYIAPDGKLMAAPITVHGATLDPGTPVALFQTRIYGGGTQPTPNVGQQYDVARDGRFLMNIVLEDTDAPSPITILQNWKPSKP